MLEVAELMQTSSEPLFVDKPKLQHDEVLEGLLPKPPDYESEFSKSEGKPGDFSRTSSSSALSDTPSLVRSPTGSSDSTVDLADDLPPPYTPALHREGVAHLKPELDCPFMRSGSRSWKFCSIEVSNTQLRLSYASLGGFISHECTYSLQFAEVGLASDYTKREHTIRLRVEGKQFLFAFGSLEQMQSMLIALMMAISLALPLELRQLPEEIKRTRNQHRDRERRRERRRAQQIARYEQDRYHQNMSSRQRSNTSNSTNSTNSTSTTNSNHADPLTEISHNGLDSPSRARSSQGESAHSSRYTDGDIAVVPRSSLEDTSAISEESLLIETGKWDPRRRRSRFSEKDYPHLLLNAPWEGKSFLFEGKWAMIVDRKIILM